MASGWSHTLALLQDGTVMSWGEDNQGALGSGQASSDLCGKSGESGTPCRTHPVLVSGLDDVQAIAVGAGQEDSVAYGPLLPSVSGVETGQSGVASYRSSKRPSRRTKKTRRKAVAYAAATLRSGSELGGTPVRISGGDLSGASAVLFGGREAPSFTVTATGHITAISPPGAGTVDITVLTPQGESQPSANDRFTYTAPGAPSVSALAPAEGLQEGGTQVTLSGVDLGGASAVRFGSSAAAGFTVNPTGTITATSPAGTGVVDVTVETPLGHSAVADADRFTYVTPSAPTVRKLSPTKGSTIGGTRVTITGTHLTDVQNVRFGSVPAAFTVNSSTSITAVSPVASAGPVSVVVTTPAGASATSPRTSTFKYGQPTILALEPNRGPRAGGNEVKITGSGFSPGAGTTFRFGAAPLMAVECATTRTCTAIVPAARRPGAVYATAAVGKIKARGAPRRYTYE